MENHHPEFESLLTRYLNGTLREDERIRFYTLLASGDFDERLKHELFSELKNHPSITISTGEAALLDQLYESKIKPGLQREEEIALTPRRSLISRWSIAASIAVLISLAGAWLFRNRTGHTAEIGINATINKETAAIIRLTDKQFVRLPDGSTVLMNEGAELTYNGQTFGAENRTVELKGEAFFDIASDPARAFIVESGSIRTTVLGTAFNIRAVPGEKMVQITVSRGKVSVGDGLGTYKLLTADEQLTINTVDNTFSKKEIKSSTVTEWTDDFLIMEDVTMAEAAQQISRKFKVAIEFKNASLKNCFVTASFLNGESLDHVLEVISTIHDIKFTYHKEKNLVEMDGENKCE